MLEVGKKGAGGGVALLVMLNQTGPFGENDIALAILLSGAICRISPIIYSALNLPLHAHVHVHLPPLLSATPTSKSSQQQTHRTKQPHTVSENQKTIAMHCKTSPHSP